MAYMMIDDQRVELEGEKNILDVIRKAEIELPTFCYYSELSIYGACRMCVVEDQKGNIMASCSSVPQDGMVIKTNTIRLQKHRKMILELLLSSHCRDCTTCEKNQRCKLQELAIRFGIKTIRFENTREDRPIDNSSYAITIDPNKCILCGDCVRVCTEKQGVGVIDFVNRGSQMMVSPAFHNPLGETACVNCGQCSNVCPTGAIVVKNETSKAWKAIYNDKIRTVVQVAPAVRVALGDEFGIESGDNVMGKIVAALRRLGFDEVYDTSLSADLTVMEEAKEFLNRLEKNEKLPLFTSCCPAWVKFVEEKHPEYLDNVSTCRSPMQMMGAVLKEHYRGTKEIDGRETYSIAVMPCTAKKYEAARDEFITDGEKDTDLVLTTQELIYMIKEAGIVFEELEPEAPDMPFGLASGAGVIFGVTGGVTEAVLRRCTEDRSAKALNYIPLTGIRGKDGIKTATVNLGGKDLNIAVVHGLTNVEHLMQQMKDGEAHFDFIEVMACPEGCISGGGQPRTKPKERAERAKGLYSIDKTSQIKRSDENPMIIALYNGILKNKKSKLLHVHYHGKE